MTHQDAHRTAPIAGIDCVVDDEKWLEALPEIETLASQCHAAAVKIEPDLEGEIALMLCDDATIQGLNAKFRHKDKATNVLSFPSGDEQGFLGDIALARETCMREAAAGSATLRDHAAHLIIHGMLHLIGYDHETDEEAEVMEAREAEILQSMGIANPYEVAQDE